MMRLTVYIILYSFLYLNDVIGSNPINDIMDLLLILLTIFYILILIIALFLKKHFG